MKFKKTNPLVIPFLLIFGIIFLSHNFVNAQSYASWYNDAQKRIDTLRKGDFGIQILIRTDNHLLAMFQFG